MELEKFPSLAEFMEADLMGRVNQQVCPSLRKKGIKLREFKWHEVQAS
ncbi:hypothetical protein HYV84_03785 [Candidatus Woesearchaeota archaeon]|nr:hypothetical protein [Candidatus Woesearchaeota archaeon]